MLNKKGFVLLETIIVMSVLLIGIEPHHIEGEKSEWYCLDYVGCVVHILLKQQRGFYQIERLWEDGEKLNIDDLIIKD